MGQPEAAAAATKVELAVEMTCQSCVDDIKKTLSALPGVEAVSVDLASQQVVVSSHLPTAAITDTLAAGGRKVIVRGQGAQQDNLGAAVCILDTGSGPRGLVRFVQVSDSECVVDGTITGLAPGKHAINIHQFGDISNGCTSCGPHFNPSQTPHGAPTDPPSQRHVGDLGNIEADSKGKAVFRFTDRLLNVWDVIGRSVVVHERPDDLGRGTDEASKVDGNAGPGLACGIIARSAGIFQNTKTFCACSGKTMWDENANEFN